MKTSRPYIDPTLLSYTMSQGMKYAAPEVLLARSELSAAQRAWISTYARLAPKGPCVARKGSREWKADMSALDAAVKAADAAEAKL